MSAEPTKIPAPNTTPDDIVAILSSADDAPKDVNIDLGKPVDEAKKVKFDDEEQKQEGDNKAKEVKAGEEKGKEEKEKVEEKENGEGEAKKPVIPVPPVVRKPIPVTPVGHYDLIAELVPRCETHIPIPLKTYPSIPWRTILCGPGPFPSPLTEIERVTGAAVLIRTIQRTIHRRPATTGTQVKLPSFNGGGGAAAAAAAMNVQDIPEQLRRLEIQLAAARKAQAEAQAQVLKQTQGLLGVETGLESGAGGGGGSGAGGFTDNNLPPPSPNISNIPVPPSPAGSQKNQAVPAMTDLRLKMNELSDLKDDVAAKIAGGKEGMNGMDTPPRENVKLPEMVEVTGSDKKDEVAKEKEKGDIVNVAENAIVEAKSDANKASEPAALIPGPGPAPTPLTSEAIALAINPVKEEPKPTPDNKDEPAKPVAANDTAKDGDATQPPAPAPTPAPVPAPAPAPKEAKDETPEIGIHCWIIGPTKEEVNDAADLVKALIGKAVSDYEEAMERREDEEGEAEEESESDSDEEGLEPGSQGAERLIRELQLLDVTSKVGGKGEELKV